MIGWVSVTELKNLRWKRKISAALGKKEFVSVFLPCSIRDADFFLQFEVNAELGKEDKFFCDR